MVEEMAEGGVGGDAGGFGCDDGFDLGLDTVVVALDSRLHLRLVGSVVFEVGYEGNGLIIDRLSGNPSGVDYNLGMKNLLRDSFIEIIGHGADKHALRECRNLTGRDKRVELGVDGVGVIIAVDAD